MPDRGDKTAMAVAKEEFIFKGMPDCPFTRDELDSAYMEPKGAIPALSEWFYPKKNGIRDVVAIAKIASEFGYRDWNPKEIIRKYRTWKDEDSFGDLPFCFVSDAKAIVDSWYKDNLLDENWRKISANANHRHLARLLTHENAPACKNFALIYMKEILKWDRQQIMDLTPKLRDGSENGTFWTFAPYILEGLRMQRKEMGMEYDDEQDFLKILWWAKMRKSIGNDNAEYLGITSLSRSMNDLHLPKDGNHPIHKLVAKAGRHIASYLKDIPVTREILLEGLD